MNHPCGEVRVAKTLAYSLGGSYLVGGHAESKAAMSKPVIVSIPHRLGKEEARRRIETGLGGVRTHFASVLTVQEEVWSGDNLAFRASLLNQQTSGTIAVTDDHV